MKALLKNTLPDPTRLAFGMSVDLWMLASPTWLGQVDMDRSNYTNLVQYSVSSSVALILEFSV